MARPRLVEEGVPIGSTTTALGLCNDDNDDEDMTMELDHDGMEDRQKPLAEDAATRPPGLIDSSLMRAVGGQIRIRNPKRRSNRIVIGRGTSEVDCEASPPSAHHHLHHHSERHSSWRTHNKNDRSSSAPHPTSSYHTPPRHFEIVGQAAPEDDIITRMEGVEDLSSKQPLVVLDGANIAYGYNLTEHGPADARGILVAVQYWIQHHIRVLVVLPQPWFHNNNEMGQLVSSIQHLLVPAPSRDDDDAYALQIAMRENARARQRSLKTGRPLEGPAYVVSNDMFRDAQERDTSGHLAAWLNNDNNSSLGKGRISYTFANMGRMDDHGDPELDFLPNPRHPLVTWVEQQHQQQR